MAKETVLVTGNTYPVKDAIRALGGRWDARSNGWRVPADKAEEARLLVAGAPAQKRKSNSSRTSTEQTYMRKYGWDGRRGSSSYYSSGMYDEES